MRKLSLFLASLMLLLVGCNNEDVFEKEINSQEVLTEVSPKHFYGVRYSEEATKVTKGVAQKINLWYPCSTIKVKFLNDPFNMKDKIKTYAAEWERYAGIKFEFITEGNAQVRIGFDWNDERYITWSYIGTDCKSVKNQNEATMSFAFWDSSTEMERKGDVLRAFGQVLGLELEHRHLKFNPGWTSRIASYWEGEIEDKTWDELKTYVFDPLEASEVISTKEYDPNSIMIWPFSSRYAANTGRSFNYELSAADIEFIQKLYPKCEEDAIVTMKTENQQVTLSISKNITIDWGDGNTQINNSSGYLNHTYATSGEHTIKLFGNTEELTHLFCYGGFTALDVSKATKLVQLNCVGNILTQLDLSKNTELQHLLCGGNRLRELNLSNNEKLIELVCFDNQLTTLDVSKNMQLQILLCGNNQMESLIYEPFQPIVHLMCSGNRLKALDTPLYSLIVFDCTGNQLFDISPIIKTATDLKELHCSGNQIHQLNVSHNRYLENLYCENNPLEKLDLSENPFLLNLYIQETQLIRDREALVKMAESLIYHAPGGNQAELVLNSAEAKNWIEDICLAKNWKVVLY